MLPFNTSPAASLPKRWLPRAAGPTGQAQTRAGAAQEHSRFISTPSPALKQHHFSPSHFTGRYLSISRSPPCPQITHSRAEQGFLRFPTQNLPRWGFNTLLLPTWVDAEAPCCPTVRSGPARHTKIYQHGAGGRCQVLWHGQVGCRERWICT